MGDWCAPEHEPIILVGGQGVMLRDQPRGAKYIDGNASIWTNVHGHNHPRIKPPRSARNWNAWRTRRFLGTTNPAGDSVGPGDRGEFSARKIWARFLFGRRLRPEWRRHFGSSANIGN
jgi:hypothetical protein